MNIRRSVILSRASVETLSRCFEILSQPLESRLSPSGDVSSGTKVFLGKNLAALKIHVDFSNLF